MKKPRKLGLSRETLHNLELPEVLQTARGAFNTLTCPPTWIRSCTGSCVLNCTADCVN